MNVEHITWSDSHSDANIWVDPDDIFFHEIICHSIGFVLKENEKLILITAHYSPKQNGRDNEQVSGHMVIPKCSIVSRKVLFEQDFDIKDNKE
jgi:hypothetical protein